MHENRDWLDMVERPDFYIGRGPNNGDCSGVHIARIACLIAREISPEAAHNFVRVIMFLDDLSASNVLGAVYKLERSEWKNWKSEVTAKDQFEKLLEHHNEPGVRDQLQAAVSIFMFEDKHRDHGDDLNLSDAIRADFCGQMGMDLVLEDNPSPGAHAFFGFSRRKLDRISTLEAFDARQKSDEPIDYEEVAKRFSPNERSY